MKKGFKKPIDLTKVNTLVYHVPDGPSLSVEMEEFKELVDIDIEIGDVCDTTDIDGVLHFFRRGNA